MLCLNQLGTQLSYKGVMKHDMQFAPSLPEAAGKVQFLQHLCELQLDPAPLADIYAHKGEVAASDTVCRALEDMAERLNRLVMAHARAQHKELAAPASRIAAIADQIGLVEVAKSARSVANTAAQNDATALEATLSRLERCFDVAINQVWSFHDLI